MEAIEADTHRIDEAVPTPDKNKAKPSWYSKLKENPDALAEPKKKKKEKYEAEKLIKQAMKQSSAEEEIIKKAIKPFEGFLKQGNYQIKNNKKFLNYTMITGEGIGTKNNKIVIHSLLDKVCYELLLTEQDGKNSVYTFAWDNTCMTEKEAIELTVAFLK